MIVKLDGFCGAEDLEPHVVKLGDSEDWQKSRVETAGPMLEYKCNTEMPIAWVSDKGLKTFLVETAQRIMESPVVRNVCLPDCVFPPKYNRYETNDFYGDHCDEPLARDNTGRRLRADLAYTLLLSSPEDYEGGELVVFDGMSDPQTFKEPAGTLIIYPSIFVHRVAEITSGVRYAVIGWLQSLMVDPALRMELFRVNKLLDKLGEKGERELFVELEAHRNMLIRLWSY